MTKNVGGIDRIVRIIVGLALIAWALLGSSTLAVWGWIGVVPLLTGLIGWCPPYASVGINSCNARASK